MRVSKLKKSIKYKKDIFVLCKDEFKPRPLALL